ncbi:MAG: tetratricopeptide repeat protein [Candidatus Binatus sp.]|uniref:tetratricopeptide repeat protein n=1 Tax=Candidatus Binatus sp. TaxID=2811406 RepID=UPI00271DB72A|nr:tetratricopeptide repeat protein [Candidatus Binatus sp.]MDO8434551.1 tetratricopeptide repeat protein [Candidatus Binatus sp.]
MLTKRRTNLTWQIRMIALAAVFLAVAGCHRKNADDYLAQGDAAMQATKLPEAEAAYLEAIKVAPNDPRTHIALGNLYVFEHKAGPAQVEFMKVLETDPKNAATHVVLGNLFVDQNQMGSAENQFRAAVILEPERPNHHLQLAEALRKQGKLMEAEAEIRAAIGLVPKDAQAHLALGNLLAAEPGRSAEANVEYDQVRAIDAKLLPAAAVPPAPVAATAPSTMTASTSGGPAKIKPLNKLFLLTKNSSVYENPDVTSHAIGQVRRKKYVHVTGITGEFLQIKMKNGTVGFIPVSAAE